MKVTKKTGLKRISLIHRMTNGGLAVYAHEITEKQWDELWQLDDDCRTYQAREKEYIPKNTVIYSMDPKWNPKTKRESIARTKDLVETYNL